MLLEPWHVDMFGGLVGRQLSQTISRFRTRKAADLLAYLAYYPSRAHSRDELVDVLWPDSDFSAARHNLRQALTSLRRQFEPPGVPSGSVFIADRSMIRVNAAAIDTDVAQFETLLRSISSGTPLPKIAETLASAVSLYCGELLAGSYSEWVMPERDRLAQAHRDALIRLCRVHEQAGNTLQSLDCALRLVAVDPCCEEAHCSIIKAYAASGRRDEAVKQSRAMVRALWEQLRERPSEAALSLIGTLRDYRPLTVNVACVEPIVQPEAPLIQRSPGVTKLPLTFTRFFGRESEIDYLCDRLSTTESRLVTITGPGGCGKTRLAIEVGRRMATAFDGMATFVPLADIEDYRLIPAAIVAAMQIECAPSADPFDRLNEALSQSRQLLIIDNYEKLVKNGSAIVGSLLQSLPLLSCLVTSRRPLQIEGEQLFPLDPLPIASASASPERLMEFPSVQLCVDRAQRVIPDFQITPRNAGDVAAVCSMLEGIPLALELAAARAHVMSPRQIMAQLDNRFDFLVSRRNDMPERHKTMRAAIEWSYHLLSPMFQAFANSLSVFRGGWDLQGAESVCADVSQHLGENVGESDSVLGLLEYLRDHSLILTEHIGSDVRFRMLETLREFAHERTDIFALTELQGRHARYFRSLAEVASEHMHGPEYQQCIAQLDREHDNLRAALSWSIDRDLDTALRLTGSLFYFWHARGHVSEGRQWLARVLAAPGERSAAALAKALLASSSLAGEQGDTEMSARHARECLGICRAHNDSRGAAAALFNLGCISLRAGKYDEASKHFGESLALRREIGDREHAGTVLHLLGRVATAQGDFELADDHLQTCLDMNRIEDNLPAVASILISIGELKTRLGEFEEAELRFRESLDLLRGLRRTPGIALALQRLAATAQRQNKHERARELYAESLGLLSAAGSRETIADSLDGVSALALGSGNFGRAARLTSAAANLRIQIGVALPREIATESDQYLFRLRHNLGPSAFDENWNAGLNSSWQAAVQEALAELSADS